MCSNFIHEWRDLQFKINSNGMIFRETLHDNFYLSAEFLKEFCGEEAAAEIFFHIFVLISELEFEPWPLPLISQHAIY